MGISMVIGHADSFNTPKAMITEKPPIRIESNQLIAKPKELTNGKFLLISHGALFPDSGYLVVVSNANPRINSLHPVRRAALLSPRLPIEYNFSFFRPGPNFAFEESEVDADIRAEILQEVRKVKFNNIALLHVAVLRQDQFSIKDPDHGLS